MNKKQIKMLVRIITAAVLMIALTVLAKFVTLNRWVEFILFMVPYLVIGYDILKKAGKGILNKQVSMRTFLWLWLQSERLLWVIIKKV